MSPPTSTLTSTPHPPPDALNLPEHYLSLYRRIFYSALETKKVQPFLLPFCLLGSFILPIAYLCIPQYRISTLTVGNEKKQVRIQREWVHRLRWLVGAVLIWWNLGVVVGFPGFGGGLFPGGLGFGGLGSGVQGEGTGEGPGSGGEMGMGEGYGGWWKAGRTTASACTAMAYAAGLMCGWGTIWGLETVVFGGYQGAAMRVRRRVRSSPGQSTQGKVMVDGTGDGKGEKAVGGKQARDGEKQKNETRVKGELKVGFINGNTNGDTNINGTVNRRKQSKSELTGGIKRGSWGHDTTDLRRRNLNLSDMFDSGSWELIDTGYGKVALPVSTESTKTTKKQQSQSPGHKLEGTGQRWRVDETVDLDKYEYYWEPYPDTGTRWERLNWVVDMFNSFRGAGWNYSISSIPSLQAPVIPPLPEFILTTTTTTTTTSSSSSSSSSSTSQVQILPYHPNVLPVSFNNLPLKTPQSFHRPLTARQFLLSRLLHITWSYLILDFFTISARLDPYFVLGPSGPLRHPDYLSSLASSSPSTLPPLSLACAKFLAALPPWALNFTRSLFSLSGVLGGLFLYSYVWQLAQFFVLGRWLGNQTQGMDELWRYPCFFGGFVSNVLDRGLAGFWGGWWHQSFRVGFTGPVRFLEKLGVFGDVSPVGGTAGTKWTGEQVGGKADGGKQAGGKGAGTAREKRRNKKLLAMTEMAIAFFMSGILHALGGWTSTAFRITPSSPSSPGKDMLTGETRNRLAAFAEPVGFFVSQFFGCLIQAFLIVVLRNLVHKITANISGCDEKGKVWKEMPRWLKRIGNGVFVVMWLHWTRWMLIDDMSRSGLFLFEPVPVSVFRLLGLGGMPGEGRADWWRLYGEYLPSLWRGDNFWTYGIRI